MVEQDRSETCDIERVFYSLLAKCDENPRYALIVFSASIVLIEHLLSGLPQAERQAWATQLYKLADLFACSEPPK